jgi:uroporphyrinogen-III synthase
MRLLVTRPEPDATRSADALRLLGHEAVVAPLTRMETIAAEFGGPFSAVLMTSANAARAVAQHARLGEITTLPLFTVGARSADAAREAGFVRVMSADGAQRDLVRLAAMRLPRGTRLLYLAGEDRAGDLPGDLAQHGILVETAVIYRAAARDALPREALSVISALDGALHYSPRSVETLLRLAERAGALGAVLSLAHYCLSAVVARPLRAAGAARVSVSAHPDETALFGLIQIPRQWN